MDLNNCLTQARLYLEHFSLKLVREKLALASEATAP